MLCATYRTIDARNLNLLPRDLGGKTPPELLKRDLQCNQFVGKSLHQTRKTLEDALIDRHER